MPEDPALSCGHRGSEGRLSPEETWGECPLLGVSGTHGLEPSTLTRSLGSGTAIIEEGKGWAPCCLRRQYRGCHLPPPPPAWAELPLPTAPSRSSRYKGPASS